jgi:hypothetical protein
MGMDYPVASSLSSIHDPATASSEARYEYPTQILLTTAADACAALGVSGPEETAASQLSMGLGAIDASGVHIKADQIGDYPIGSSSGAPARYSAAAFSSPSSGSMTVAWGIVHVAAVDADTGAVSGTYDLTFNDGERITGRFSSSNCPGL